MDCVFCRIIAGELDAAVVTRTDEAIVFLDRSPLFHGHCLVVPLEHHVTLPDLPPERVGPFFATVQRVAAALPPALGAGGSFVAMNNIISQSVPHLHAHVVPRKKKDGLRGFFWPRKRYTGGMEEMKAIAQTISEHL